MERSFIYIVTILLSLACFVTTTLGNERTGRSFASSGVTFDCPEPVPANRFPRDIVTIVGKPINANSGSCTFFASSNGKPVKGITLSIEPEVVSLSPPFDTRFDFPRQTTITNVNGLGTFQIDLGDFTSEPLLMFVSPEVRGSKKLDSLQISCTAGVREEGCDDGKFTGCLVDNRFRVDVKWRTKPGARFKSAVVKDRTDTDAVFNLGSGELLIRMSNLCDDPNFLAYSAFVQQIKIAETLIQIVDTKTGAFKEYHNPSGKLPSEIVDTRAFATCCSQNRCP